MKAKIYVGAKKYALYIGRKIVQKTLEFLTLPARFVSKKVQDLKNYLIYGNSVQNGTPTPTAPVEIESVGDKSKNLFGKNDVIWGYHINANGEVVASNLNSCSDFIPCQPNTTYTLTYKSNLPEKAGSTIRMHSYDENKNWIEQNLAFSVSTVYGQGYKGMVEVQYTTSANAKYTRFTFKGISDTDETLSTNIQLEEGSTATPYEPYYDGYKIPVTVGGKNLFNNKNPNYRIDDTGSLVADTGSKCTDFISVNYNDIYTASCLGSGGTSTTAWICVLYDKDKTFISGSRITNVSNLMTITVNKEDAKYLRLCKRGAGITNVQLELGSQATSYQPYIQSTTTNIYLDQPLRKIGEYTDYIDFENQKIVRNTKEINCKDLIFDSYNKNHYIYTDVSLDNVVLPVKGTPTIALCNRFIAVDTDEMQTANLTFGIGYSSGKLFIHYNNWNSLQDGINYLNSNDTIVVYPLATPTEQQISLPPISLTQNTVTINIDTTIQPSKLVITGDIDNE